MIKKFINNTIIRKEEKQDRDKVFRLVEMAFLNAEHRDGGEHYLVEKLRKSKSFIPELSLVAQYENNIVGYILFTEVKIGGTTQLALAPLAVLPDYQNQGIGSMLIKEGHKKAAKSGYEYSIVLGDPSYYSRFGYLPSTKFKIKCPFDIDSKYFMAVNLQGKTTEINAVVEYPEEFNC